MFKILGRIAWSVLEIIAPPMGRKFQHELTGSPGETPSRLARVKKIASR